MTMTPEDLATNENLNTFYRSLIALQWTALDYISSGEGIEDRVERAVTATGWINDAKQLMARAGCSNCSGDEVCCNDGSCALPGFCGIGSAAAAAVAQRPVKTASRTTRRPRAKARVTAKKKR